MASLCSYHQKVAYDPPHLELRATYGLVSPEEYQSPAMNPLWTPEVYAKMDATKAPQPRQQKVARNFFFFSFFFSSVFFIEYKSSDSCKKHGIELLPNTDNVSRNIHMYKDTYRLILTTPVCLAELLTVYKPTHHLCSSSDTSILSLPSVHMHSLGRRSFLMLHHLSGNSLARLDHQTYSPLLNIFEIFPLKLSYWLCVCVCLQKFVLTVFCSLLCDRLCAPIWRNSTWESASLLSVVCVLKYIYTYA